jgi:hypothetical protein
VFALVVSHAAEGAPSAMNSDRKAYKLYIQNLILNSQLTNITDNAKDAELPTFIVTATKPLGESAILCPVHHRRPCKTPLLGLLILSR